MPVSRHFTLQRLAEGVYAAIATPGGGALGNAGIIDLGDSTLIFDAFYTPQAAYDLRAAAEQLAPQPITYVVNSHADGDHVFGNQAFSDIAAILASHTTRAAMADRGAALLNWARLNQEAYMRTRASYVANEPDADRRQRLERKLATEKEFTVALPDLKLVLPTVTFEQRMILHGSKRSVQLITPGGGHSESDTFLILPTENIAFMGDLLFVRVHPTTWKGNPIVWITLLEQVEHYDLSVLVPGHGPVGSMDDVRLLRELLEKMLRLAANVVERKGSAAETAELPVPAPYDNWESPELFARNMRYMHEVLAKRELVLTPLPPKVKRDAQGRPIRDVGEA